MLEGNKKSLIIVIACVSLCLLNLLSACVPVLVGAGVAMGGQAAIKEKTIGESISDTTIKAKIRASFIKHEVNNLFGSINIKVNEGVILLTGYIDKKEDIITVLKLVWQQDGVKDVINELKITSNNEKPNLGSVTQDSWITTRIKAKLLFNADIRSINYSVETIEGVVYLFGIARNMEESEEVKDVASSVSGVKNIISYIRVKKDADSNLKSTKGRGVKPSLSDKVYRDGNTNSSVGSSGNNYPFQKSDDGSSSYDDLEATDQDLSSSDNESDIFEE